MRIGDNVDELSYLHVAFACQHVGQHRVLGDIPGVCRKNVLRALVQDRIKHELAAILRLGNVKGHAVRAGIEHHLRKVRVHIDVCHDTAAERIVLQIVDDPVDLVEHALFVFVLNAHLIAVSLADSAVLVLPLVPYMGGKIRDAVRLFLPDPEHLLGT